MTTFNDIIDALGERCYGAFDISIGAAMDLTFVSSRDGYEFLIEIARSLQLGHECDFHIHPSSPGSVYFKPECRIGLYLHRRDNCRYHAPPILGGGSSQGLSVVWMCFTGGFDDEDDPSTRNDTGDLVFEGNGQEFVRLADLFRRRIESSEDLHLAASEMSERLGAPQVLSWRLRMREASDQDRQHALSILERADREHEEDRRVFLESVESSLASADIQQKKAFWCCVQEDLTNTDRPIWRHDTDRKAHLALAAICVRSSGVAPLRSSNLAPPDVDILPWPLLQVQQIFNGRLT